MSFEKATRKKYRFESIKGQLNVEQLWDLPLQSKSGFDLDSVAQELNTELQRTSTSSFVKPVNSARKTQLEEQLAIVVHIITVKQAENEAAAKSAERAAQRRQLEEILHTRRAQDLASLTPEQIEAKLAELDKLDDSTVPTE